MSSNSPVVLLVDDDEMCRVVIQAYLEAHGLTVITVTSARAAFGVLQSTPINAVVSDFEMPEMNGLELAAVVKGSHPKSAILHYVWQRLSIGSGSSPPFGRMDPQRFACNATAGIATSFGKANRNTGLEMGCAGNPPSQGGC